MAKHLRQKDAERTVTRGEKKDNVLFFFVDFGLMTELGLIFPLFSLSIWAESRCNSASFALQFSPFWPAL